MKRANMETVTANPKRRDFSDCFTWALLARPGAILDERRG